MNNSPSNQIREKKWPRILLFLVIGLVAFSSAMKELSQAQALKHGQPLEGIEPSETRHVIESVTEIICLEIQKTFDFFKTTTTVEHIDRMLVSGGVSHTPGLIETLARKFEIPTEKFDTFKNISYDPKRFSPALMAERAPELAVAIGLAGVRDPVSPRGRA